MNIESCLDVRLNKQQMRFLNNAIKDFTKGTTKPMAESLSSKCNVCGSKRIDSDILICDSCTEYYCDDCSIQCDVVNPIHDTFKDCNISTSCSVCEMSYCNKIVY